MPKKYMESGDGHTVRINLGVPFLKFLLKLFSGTWVGLALKGHTTASPKNNRGIVLKHLSQIGLG